MAKFGLPKGSGKRLNVREKSVKSQGILKWILSGNPVFVIFEKAAEFCNCRLLQIIGGALRVKPLLSGRDM